MHKVMLINDDAKNISAKADLILTDPPYNMDGRELAQIIDAIDCQHLVMLTTMQQLLEFYKYSSYKLNFDFVINAVVPKQAKSIHAPNYTHQTGVYMTKGRVKTKFNRKLRQRSDNADANGYWPTIFRAPRDRMQEHGLAKNLNAITDLLGSFEGVEIVIDPFAGSGTAGLAAYELSIDSILVERDADYCRLMNEQFEFLGVSVEFLGIQ